MAERCIDCGKRASRGLKYCDVCRRVHFTHALKLIKESQPPTPNVKIISASTTESEKKPAPMFTEWYSEWPAEWYPEWPTE